MATSLRDVGTCSYYLTRRDLPPQGTPVVARWIKDDRVARVMPANETLVIGFLPFDPIHDVYVGHVSRTVPGNVPLVEVEIWAPDD